MGEYIAAGVDGRTIVYFLYINDAGKASSFGANNSGYIDLASKNFDVTSNVGGFYKTAYDEFIDRGYGSNAAHEYAFAYVLSHYDTGIILFKVSDGHFTPTLVGRDESHTLLDQFYLKVPLCNFINNNN